MPFREYYTVDRSPQEIRDLWDWAQNECSGLIEHENPYAMGVCAAMNYLMGETEERPHDYKGVFSLQNVLRQSDASGDSGKTEQAGSTDAGTSRPGNPRGFFFRVPRCRAVETAEK